MTYFTTKYRQLVKPPTERKHDLIEIISLNSSRKATTAPDANIYLYLFKRLMSTCLRNNAATETESQVKILRNCSNVLVMGCV